MLEIQLAERQQQDVWEGWLGAEIRANYFADLSAHYQTQQKVLTWLTLLFSSGAAAAFLSDGLPPEMQWVKPALALLASGVSIFSLIQQNQKRITDCADLYFRWSRLANDYKSLWDNMYAPESFGILSGLAAKEAELSKSSTALPNNQRAMMKWQDYVEGQHNLTSAA